MACDRNRVSYFKVLAARPDVQEALGLNEAQTMRALERFYQTGLSAGDQKKSDVAELAVATERTRRLFKRMRALGIKPPDGLPRKAARFGYAQIEQLLDAIEKGEKIPEAAVFFAKQVAAAKHAPISRPIRTLRGHTDLVRNVAVTPDGRYAVSASGDGTLKVWELQSGKLIRSIPLDERTVAVSNDGRRIICGSFDGTIKVLDLASGNLLRSLEGHTDIVNEVVVTRDDRHAVSCSEDRTLKVWNLEDGRLQRSLEGHTDRVFTGALTPDERKAVSGAADNTLKVWDLTSGRLLHSIPQSSWVNSVKVTPDGRYAVVVPALEVLDLESGRAVRSLKGHTALATAIALSPDGRYAIVAWDDSILSVFDLSDGRLLRYMEGHTFWVSSVTVMPDGRHVVSSSFDGTVKVWNL